MRIPNPLDDFQSYSVQYVMLACRTTVSAGRFATDDSVIMAASLQAIEDAKYLGAPVVFGDGAQDVFLVLDTRRFAQFTVESLKYDVWINGLQKGASTSNLATDLSMVVLDSVGISFANFMQWLMDEQMETNFDGLVFMLRTIFVGHHPDGSTETIQVETIPMHLRRMDINLDYAKGAYTLDFIPNMNFDVSQNSRFLTVSTATSYTTGAGNTLLGLINSFEDQMNKKSKEYFDGIQKIIQDSGRGSGKPLGRKVEYMITIPESWNKFEITGSNTGECAEQIFTKANPVAKPKEPEAGKIKNSYAAAEPGAEITKVLDAVFKQVPDIAKMGNFKTDQSANKSNDFVIFYKYIVGLTSDDTTMVVHVDIVEFKIPNIIAQQNQSAAAVSEFEKEFYDTVIEQGVSKRVPKDFIEYDYIFSGKNKDILTFDIKIQDFQFLLAGNLKLGENAVAQVVDTSGKTNDVVPIKDDNLFRARQYDPLVMPTNSKAALDNFRNYSTQLMSQKKSAELITQSQQYTKNLSMFYAGSSATVLITIKGNPLIMHKFNMGKFLHNKDGGSNRISTVAGSSDKAEYRKNLENSILQSNPDIKKDGATFTLQNTGLSSKSYATSPVYSKINIMGPNVDFRTNEPASDPAAPYATSVLSDNYYVIFKVSNHFINGVFTQELQLNGVSVFGRSSNVTTTTNAQSQPKK